MRRLLLDVYHHIRENTLDDKGRERTKLGAISEHFLEDKKEDIHYTEIPKLQSESARNSSPTGCVLSEGEMFIVHCDDSVERAFRDVYLPLR